MTYPALVVDGDLGPTTIKALQYRLGITQDGSWGPVTTRALQSRLHVPLTGRLDRTTIVATQRLVGVPADGDLGGQAVSFLQLYLNAKLAGWVDVPGSLAALGFWRSGLPEFRTAVGLSATYTADKGTRQLIKDALDKQHRGVPNLTAHFSLREFACHCGGTLPGCRKIKVTRRQALAMETYRVKHGAPVQIVSPYRCAAYNARVGGASASQHLTGAACDVPQVHDYSWVKGLGVFTAIGIVRATGRVLHVDTRPGSTSAPVVWYY